MTSPRKIMIVEDNALNMELAADLLSLAGYEVLQATTAERGIQLARTLMPHLILMDKSLPGMDGLQATRMLKADPLTRNIPVVSLTANAMKGDEETALAAGAVAYITKPIDTRTFANTIAAFLNLTTAAPGISPEADRQPNQNLDLNALRSRFKGKEELLQRMIRILREQTPQLLKRIRQAAAASDAPALEHAAHALRGSLLQFGAHTAAQLAQQLEQRAESGVTGEIQAMTDQLEVQAAEIQRILNNL